MQKEGNKMNILSCGIEFVSAVATGAGIGWLLDSKFETFPIWMIVFFIMGCVAGYFNILRYANRDR